MFILRALAIPCAAVRVLAAPVQHARGNDSQYRRALHDVWLLNCVPAGISVEPSSTTIVSRVSPTSAVNEDLLLPTRAYDYETGEALPDPTDDDRISTETKIHAYETALIMKTQPYGSMRTMDAIAVPSDSKDFLNDPPDNKKLPKCPSPTSSEEEQTSHGRFCFPKEGDVLHIGRSYFVTWDLSFLRTDLPLGDAGYFLNIYCIKVPEDEGYTIPGACSQNIQYELRPGDNYLIIDPQEGWLSPDSEPHP